MLLATVSVLDAAVARWPLAMMANGPAAFFAVTERDGDFRLMWKRISAR